jgi:hypothetical protein
MSSHIMLVRPATCGKNVLLNVSNSPNLPCYQPAAFHEAFQEVNEIFLQTCRIPFVSGTALLKEPSSQLLSTRA